MEYTVRIRHSDGRIAINDIGHSDYCGLLRRMSPEQQATFEAGEQSVTLSCGTNLKLVNMDRIRSLNTRRA